MVDRSPGAPALIRTMSGHGSALNTCFAVAFQQCEPRLRPHAGQPVRVLRLARARCHLPMRGDGPQPRRHRHQAVPGCDGHLPRLPARAEGPSRPSTRRTLGRGLGSSVPSPPASTRKAWSLGTAWTQTESPRLRAVPVRLVCHLSGPGCEPTGGTVPKSINTAGATAGPYFDATCLHGFVRDAAGHFANLSAPDGPGGTRPSANNSWREVTRRNRRLDRPDRFNSFRLKDAGVVPPTNER